MTPPKPILTIIAGPNGSGKSTFTRATSEALRVPVIDPDLEARNLQPDNPEGAAVSGGKQAIKRARAYLDSGESFAVETTRGGQDAFPPRHFSDAGERRLERLKPPICCILTVMRVINISLNRISRNIASR